MSKAKLDWALFEKAAAAVKQAAPPLAPGPSGPRSSDPKRDAELRTITERIHRMTGDHGLPGPFDGMSPMQRYLWLTSPTGRDPLNPGRRRDHWHMIKRLERDYPWLRAAASNKRRDPWSEGMPFHGSPWRVLDPSHLLHRRRPSEPSSRSWSYDSFGKWMPYTDALKGRYEKGERFSEPDPYTGTKPFTAEQYEAARNAHAGDEWIRKLDSARPGREVEVRQGAPSKPDF